MLYQGFALQAFDTRGLAHFFDWNLTLPLREGQGVLAAFNDTQRSLPILYNMVQGSIQIAIRGTQLNFCVGLPEGASLATHPYGITVDYFIRSLVQVLQQTRITREQWSSLPHSVRSRTALARYRRMNPDVISEQGEIPFQLLQTQRSNSIGANLERLTVDSKSYREAAGNALLVDVLGEETLFVGLNVVGWASDGSDLFFELFTCAPPS